MVVVCHCPNSWIRLVFSNTGDDLEDASSLRHISVEDFERAFIKMKQSKFLSPMSMRFIDVE